ncbi:response regulator transcription factor [Brevibacillus reuszeri]|uniref:response regulator transcription factor n=1 Tax=Brevibacillus reuszeri TaxID=54915 RepID=UPI0028980137|nr:response regulator [Brevibacillus reuszeri]
MKVLIVDDEPLELLNLNSILSSYDRNAIVRSAANGMQALSLMEQQEVDIVFLDIQMPGWNGLETLERIKRGWPDVQVALISAHGEFHYAKTAMELGVCGYILKPVVPDELIHLYEKMTQELAAKRNVRPLLLQTAIEQWLGVNPLRVKVPESAWKAEFSFTPNLVLVVKTEAEQNRGMDKKERIVQQFPIALPDTVVAPQPIEGFWVYLSHVDNDREVQKFCELLAYRKLRWEKTYPELQWTYGVGERVDSLDALRKSFFSAIKVSQNKEEAIIGQCLSFLSKHYELLLTINDLASEVHISPSHLSRILKKRLGITFVDLLTKLRIEKAKELLDNPALSIEYISHCVGFSSPNYFAVTFRKLQGQSPREYRLTSGE